MVCRCYGLVVGTNTYSVLFPNTQFSEVDLEVKCPHMLELCPKNTDTTLFDARIPHD